ncbi:MAG: hypothetical protein AVDCRST_MAG08-3733, partial [uncultured Acetobacteraceae bacterium]
VRNIGGVPLDPGGRPLRLATRHGVSPRVQHRGRHAHPHRRKDHL